MSDEFPGAMNPWLLHSQPSHFRKSPLGTNGADNNFPFKCLCARNECEILTTTAGKSGASVKKEGGTSTAMLKASSKK